jgi:hypothetical protein
MARSESPANLDAVLLVVACILIVSAIVVTIL